MIRSKLYFVLLAAGSLALVGCSDSTGPDGETGTASAAVTDDPNSTAASTALSPSFTRLGQQTSGSSDFSGTMRADVRVQVSADGSTWVDVNDQATSNSQVQLQSSGSSTTVASNAAVQAGSFSHVRLVMENSSATINSGSTFSSGGLVLDVDIDLNLGNGGSVVIEKEVETFQIGASSSTTITFDLNSEAWVNQNSVEAGAVSSSEIESATTVTVQ